MFSYIRKVTLLPQPRLTSIVPYGSARVRTCGILYCWCLAEMQVHPEPVLTFVKTAGDWAGVQTVI